MLPINLTNGMTNTAARYSENRNTEPSHEQGQSSNSAAAKVGNRDKSAVHVTLSPEAKEYLDTSSNDAALRTSISVTVVNGAKISIEYTEPPSLGDYIFDTNGGSDSVKVRVTGKAGAVSPGDISNAIMTRYHSVTDGYSSMTKQAYAIMFDGVKVLPEDRSAIPGVTPDQLLAMSNDEYVMALRTEGSRRLTEAQSLYDESQSILLPKSAKEAADLAKKPAFSSDEAKSELQNYVGGLADYISLRNYVASKTPDAPQIEFLDKTIENYLTSMNIVFSFEMDHIAQFDGGRWSMNAFSGSYRNDDAHYAFSVDADGTITA